MRISLTRISARLLLPASRPQLSVTRSWAAPFSSMASQAVDSAPPEKKQQDSRRNMYGKRPYQNGSGGHSKKLKGKKAKPAKEGSSEEVLVADIRSMLASQKLSETSEAESKESANGSQASSLPEPGSEIEVEVIELSSTGDGLARQKGSSQIYVVPSTVPGDLVKVKVFRHLHQENYSVADFISVIKPSPLRDDTRIKCQYFARCAGCQFQMLDYAEQLKLKKRIVEKAYRNFSQLPPELIPEILDTIGSPLEYGYRTKLTPHFDGAPGFRGRGKKKALREVPDIGFMQKGSRKTIDIEDCPIGTDAVRKGMQRERDRMKREYGDYERGATILLRESTKRYPRDSGGKCAAPDEIPSDAVKVETATHTDIKTCITDNNATSTEYVDSYIFTNRAGDFFQNNNSILPVFTSYVREHILPPPPSSSPGEGNSNKPTPKPIRYLIDAYSGSGLFTITLSTLLPGGSVGIDIAEKSITFARQNAKLNSLPESRCRFIAADAPELFKSVTYDPDETVVMLDPPRKGCDASFLRQLLAFGPRRVVYVSCNVHTQARDVGVLVRGEVESGDEDGQAKKGARYEIESLRGFDFFPQTGHVEGVAVLNRVDVVEEQELHASA